jgi:hypothetical protein
MATKLDQIHPRMLRVEALLDGIDAGLIVLPDFQRDFDWVDKDVRDLIVTVLSGWPAGSLLLMSGEATYFKTRPIEGAPPADRKAEYVVLDGQQRLTALYHAFRNAGDDVYAVRLGLLGQGSVDELEEAVESFGRSEWEARYGTPANQLAQSLLPLTALRSAPDFFAWRDELVGAAPGDQTENVHQFLTETYKRYFAGIHGYEFPAVVVPSRIAPAAIARIFERVNRTGMQLEAFDLVVAKSYEPGWNLRQHYQEARDTSSWIDGFLADDGLPVLQVIALKTSRNIREAAVLELPGPTVRREWVTAVRSMSAALEFLATECGVVYREWLPYRAMAVVVAGVASTTNLMDRRRELVEWFWATAFGSAYDVASNTRAVADYDMLTGHRESPADVKQVSRATIIEGTRRKQGALWRAFMCSLAANGAVDLRLLVPIAAPTGPDNNYGPGRMPIAQAIVAGTLPDQNAPRLEQRVLSQILAFAETARLLKRVGLRDVLAEGPAGQQALGTQFLPEGAGELVAQPGLLIERRVDLLASFLSQRRVRIVDEGALT